MRGTIIHSYVLSLDRARSNLKLTIITLLACFSSHTLASEQLSGHFNVGLRDVNISGDKSKYKQHAQLESGLRLFEFGLDE